MCNSNNENQMLGLIEQILIRCVVMGVIVLFLWWGALVLAGDFAYSVQAKVVPISREQFDVIHYAGMLMTKAAIFVLFLFPYIAISLVIRKRRR